MKGNKQTNKQTEMEEEEEEDRGNKTDPPPPLILALPLGLDSAAIARAASMRTSGRRPIIVVRLSRA